MHVLLFTPAFPPEIGSTSHIYFDLAHGLKAIGHEVSVITSSPRQIKSAESDFDLQTPLRENIDGINIYRVKHPVQSINNVYFRGLEHLYLPFYYYREFRKLVKKEKIVFDICILHVPPLPMYYLGAGIKRLTNIPSILNYQDFHPDEMIQGDTVPNPLIINVLTHMEVTAYKNSDYITVLNEGAVGYLVKKGVSSNKITPIYNTINLDEINNINSVDIKSQLEISDKYLITFAGRINKTQGLDKLLDAAKSMLNEERFVFYIVGDGMDCERIKSRIANEQLKNVHHLNFLPRDEYLQFIQASDVALISLGESVLVPILPGKTVSIMAAGKPILALVPEDSETARIVSKNECGIVVSSSNPKDTVDAIHFMADNPEITKSYGENGRKFVEEHMDSKVVAKQYDEIINKLLNKER